MIHETEHIKIVELLAGLTRHLLSSPKLSVPLGQRAKFEGWMKIELASALAKIPRVSHVRVEDSYSKADGNRHIADVVFLFGNRKARVMLKTINTNFRFEGVENAHRPITKNITGVIDDVHKLEETSSNHELGVIIFAMFPVSCDEYKRTRQIELHMKKLPKSSIKAEEMGFVLREALWGILFNVLSVH
jgi:hypothetical protein